MKRRWTGGCLLCLSLLVGCGGEVRRTAGEELLARESRAALVSSRDAIDATRVGLAAFVRMLDEEALQRVPEERPRRGARVVAEPSLSATGPRAVVLADLWRGVVEAHEGAAYSDEQLAFAAHAGAAVVAREAAFLEEGERRDARAGVERMRAHIVARAVEHHFSSLTGRADLRAALRSAGTRLEEGVDAALAARGAALEARLQEPWARYLAETERLLDDAVAARGPVALAAVHRLRAFVGWEAESLALSGREGGRGEAALEAVVAGLGGFYASVRSTASQLDAAGLTPSEADAALAILANLYAAAV